MKIGGTGEEEKASKREREREGGLEWRGNRHLAQSQCSRASWSESQTESEFERRGCRTEENGCGALKDKETCLGALYAKLSPFLCFCARCIPWLHAAPNSGSVDGGLEALRGLKVRGEPCVWCGGGPRAEKRNCRKLQRRTERVRVRFFRWCSLSEISEALHGPQLFRLRRLRLPRERPGPGSRLSDERPCAVSHQRSSPLEAFGVRAGDLETRTPKANLWGKKPSHARRRLLFQRLRPARRRCAACEQLTDFCMSRCPTGAGRGHGSWSICLRLQTIEAVRKCPRVDVHFSHEAAPPVPAVPVVNASGSCSAVVSRFSGSRFSSRPRPGLPVAASALTDAHRHRPCRARFFLGGPSAECSSHAKCAKPEPQIQEASTPRGLDP